MNPPPSASIFRGSLFALAALIVSPSTMFSEDTPPLALHPGNPRYFLLRNQPAILLTSGEHYGALLNADFDFETYFETLAADGFNLTRTFSGVYCEPNGAFKITRNTLAPTEGNLVAPFARSDSPGYANGGNRFDLTRWNADYFERLHAIMESASRHGIVVEFVFFCPFYNDAMWNLSPLNPNNHVDPLPQPENPNDLWTLDRGGLYLEIQERLIRKVCAELNRYDNLYFEVCNEPYQRHLPQDWHDRMAETIREAEAGLPNQHLISWNVANHGDGEDAIVHDPNPAYSIFNFHYSNPPDEVANNWHLGKPIGDNETGFDGQKNRPYRTEAWEFILAGGALFNHLDYSFAAGGHEDGTFEYPDKQPGGGNATLRKQFAALKRLVESCPIPKLHPVPDLVKSGVPKDARVQVLGDDTAHWLLYLTDTGIEKNVSLELDLPAGNYELQWIDPATAEPVKTETREHDGKAPLSLPSPALPEDLALKIEKRAG
ncbi:MAG: hypothetical protein KDN19_13735 [Verrucomicrobiae bacterium]|nr:hypothetical protein [Verrucomicrobiae bacterium]